MIKKAAVFAVKKAAEDAAEKVSDLFAPEKKEPKTSVFQIVTFIIACTALAVAVFSLVYSLADCGKKCCGNGSDDFDDFDEFDEFDDFDDLDTSGEKTEKNA